ncbi:hypothetical protein HY967_01290 [Candidatus Jorgensenbacteria bacterium]|nr:hypothetical protein [Candidatus Jorgensenbacteria bacterium]
MRFFTAIFLPLIIIIVGALSFFGWDAIQSQFFNTTKSQPAEDIVQDINTSPNKSLTTIKELPVITSEASSLDQTIEKVIAPPPLRVVKSTSGSGSALSSFDTITWTNVERVSNNIGILSENDKLSIAAKIKVRDMFDRQYFEHVSPIGVGPSGLANKVGYEFILIAENLALGDFKDDQDLVRAWMNSTGHRENILNSRFTEIGVAVERGVFEGRMVWLGVQEFGMPRSVCPESNANLKAYIEANEIELDRLSDELTKRKQELEERRRESAYVYNQKVSEYNALVNQYNELVQKTKQLIADYNVGVNAFNACADVGI